MPVVLLAACSGGPSKKVLVMSRGDIDANGTSITVKDGTGYAEKELTLSGSGKTTLNITGAPGGNLNIDVPEAGYYVLNLRTDTIVGSMQQLGKDLSSNRMISQEELKVKIDSLNQLVHGQNVSAANHNYIVTANQLVKISANTNARVFGPFHKIPSTIEPAPDGKEPELYKFYTNNEMRDLIKNLDAMTH